MNRGIARRSAFEGARDIRTFLACLARACRRGRIELHGYSILTTQDHLLVRSPIGERSQAMQQAQNRYVRYFNRSRRRDGPLFRGRFRSKRIDSLRYRKTVLAYIDANPVQAGIVRRSEDYPHGSRAHYAQPSGPPWLSRDWVESLTLPGPGSLSQERTYEEVFGPAVHQEAFDLVDKRLNCCSLAPDPLDDLVGAAPERVQDWMQRKARLADGTRAGLPICSPAALRDAIAASVETHGDWRVDIRGQPVEGWVQLEAGLLVDLCGLTLTSVSHALSKGTSTVSKLVHRHRKLLTEDSSYGQRAAEITKAGIARMYPQG